MIHAALILLTISPQDLPIPVIINAMFEHCCASMPLRAVSEKDQCGENRNKAPNCLLQTRSFGDIQDPATCSRPFLAAVASAELLLALVSSLPRLVLSFLPTPAQPQHGCDMRALRNNNRWQYMDRKHAILKGSCTPQKSLHACSVQCTSKFKL